MIVHLKGTLESIGSGRVVVDVHGLGYEVSIPESVAFRLPQIGEDVNLLTRQVFREDGVLLFGFLEPFERTMFDLLTEVKGCGPKISISLIGELGAEGVGQGILNQDVKALSRATGVGPRLAERIILELKDKVLAENLNRKVERAVVAAYRASGPADEVVDALVSLGYRRSEAEQAVTNSDLEGSVEERLMVALKVLRR